MQYLGTTGLMTVNKLCGLIHLQYYRSHFSFISLIALNNYPLPQRNYILIPFNKFLYYYCYPVHEIGNILRLLLQAYK